MNRCPHCHSTDVYLEDDLPGDETAAHLYGWRCDSCLWKWVTN